MNYEIVRTDPIIELTTICVGCKMHVFVIPYSKGNILAIPTHGISADLAGLSNEIYNLEALKEIGYNEIFAKHICKILVELATNHIENSNNK